MTKLKTKSSKIIPFIYVIREKSILKDFVLDKGCRKTKIDTDLKE